MSACIRPSTSMSPRSSTSALRFPLLAILAVVFLNSACGPKSRDPQREQGQRTFSDPTPSPQSKDEAPGSQEEGAGATKTSDSSGHHGVIPYNRPAKSDVLLGQVGPSQVDPLVDFLGVAATMKANVDALAASEVETDSVSAALQEDVQSLLMRSTSSGRQGRSSSGAVISPRTVLVEASTAAAIGRAYQNLSFHRALTRPYREISIDSKVWTSIERRFPKTGSALRRMEYDGVTPENTRAALMTATVQALIWKGDEVGALAERVGELNQELVAHHYTIPNVPDRDRPAAIKKQDELSSQLFALRVEMDRRLSEEPAFAYLSWPMRVSGHNEPVAFYVFIREQMTEIANRSPDRTISRQDPAFVRLQSEVRKLIELHHPTVQKRIVDLIGALVLQGEAALAPLPMARMQGLEAIDQGIQVLGPQYPAYAPRVESFAQINATLEKDWGFRDGEYNEYNEEDFFWVIVRGIAASELTYWASRSMPGLAVAGKQMMKQTARAATAVAGRTVGHLALRLAGWVNPYVIVGSAALVSLDVMAYYERKRYREFLKNFIPSAHLAGLTSSSMAAFAKNVDDSIVGIYLVMESVTSVFIAARFGGSSWGSRIAGVVRGTPGALRAIPSLPRNSVEFLKRHGAALLAAGGVAIRSPLQAARAASLFASHHAKHWTFIFGSVTMAADVHWKIQGYGIQGYDGIGTGVVGVLKRSYEATRCDLSTNLVDVLVGEPVNCSPGAFFTEFGRQYRNVFFDSPQAQIDLTSIALSDAVLTYGASDHKLSNVGLGHLYAWVSAASDIAGQILVNTTLRPEEEQMNVSDSWEQLQWNRVLVHYAMVSTFSTWKMRLAYQPLIHGVSRSVNVGGKQTEVMIRNGLEQWIGKGMDALINQASRALPANRSRLGSQLAEGLGLAFARTGGKPGRFERFLQNVASLDARRGFNQVAGTVGRHGALFSGIYSSSLLSNWLGNYLFISVALTMKSNSDGIPPIVTPELTQKVKQLFEESGLEFTPENIREVTKTMRAVSNLAQAELKDALNAQSQDLQSP